MRARSELAGRLHGLGAVKFGHFTLKSGAPSPVYIDLRLLVSEPTVLQLVAGEMAGLLEGLDYDRIAAVPYGGLPIGTAVALLTGRPLIYPRKEVKGHGTGRAVEGFYEPGEVVVLLDDLISSGLSKLEAIRPLEAEGLVVRDVVVLVDREGGGAGDLAAAGYRLLAALTLSELVADLRAVERITPEQAAAVAAFLQSDAGSGGDASPIGSNDG